MDKACIPCQGGLPPLANKEIKKLLEKLRGGWRLTQESHLYKEYIFSDFIEPMGFANKITEVAERARHHPDLKIA